MKLKQDVKNVWNSVPPMVRLGVTLVGGFYAFSKIKSLVGSGALVNASDLAKLKSQGVEPTYLESQYKGFADALYNAMYYVPFGTNEGAIFSIFGKMKNDVDVLKTIQAFGTRRQEFTTGVHGLAWFIADELDKSDIAQINTLFASRGITYRF